MTYQTAERAGVFLGMKIARLPKNILHGSFFERLLLLFTEQPTFMEMPSYRGIVDSLIMGNERFIDVRRIRDEVTRLFPDRCEQEAALSVLGNFCFTIFSFSCY